MRRCALVIGAVVLFSACARSDADVIKRPTGEVTRGGTLRVGISVPGSIEPTNAFEPMGSLVVETMCDTLVKADPETGKLRPAIAESWQVLNDGARITLKLRKGVRFHDGSELKSDDVVFALSRIADRDFGSSVSRLMQPVFGFSFIHGDEETDNDSYLEKLAGLRVTEEYGLEITLAEPRADFVRALAHPATSPIPKERVQNAPEAFAKQPVCAGPYRMTAPWDLSKPVIALDRFDDYYGENLAYTSGGRGYADKIEFRIDRDLDTALDSLRSGNSEVAPVPPARLAELRSDPGFFQVPSPSLEYIAIPLGNEVFRSRALRVALSKAIDRRLLVDKAFQGGRLPATGMLPPAAGDVFEGNACFEQVSDDDIDLGSLSLPKIQLSFNDEFNNRALAEEVAAQWRQKLGIEVEVAAVAPEGYLEEAGRPSGFSGPFRMSWAPPYQGPDTYLGPLMHSKSIGRENFSRFGSATFDRLLERSARRAETEEDLIVEYRRLEKLACAQMPIIPLTFGAKEYIRTPSIGSALAVFGDRNTGQPLVREHFVRKT